MAASPYPSRKRIGEILVAKGLINEDQLKKALELQKSTDDLVGALLVRMGYCTEKDVVRAFADQINVLFVDLGAVELNIDVAKLIPQDLSHRHKVVAVQREENKVLVAMLNPFNVFALDEIKERLNGLEVVPGVATEADINEAIEKVHKKTLSVSEAIEELGSEVQTVDEAVQLAQEADDTFNVGELHELGEEAPVIRMVNAIVIQAIRDRASDIHVEPQMHDLRVRYRIDGVLHTVMTPPLRLHPAIVSRIKIMGNMDIAEKRLPQDGRIMMSVEGKEYDFRVSSIPTIFGEKIELRVLDKTATMFKVHDLGFSQDLQSKFEDIIGKPYGMLLATGPTGSGKTTTLYSALAHLNTIDRNLMTIEDPIEYQLGGIAQAQVNVKAGLTFANALRSILRQDPDIVMVGEIRDKETAEIAIHSALTGHLVLSSMHTNDSSLTVVRFFHMSVEPFLVASSLIGVVSQRLARRICPRCKTTVDVSGDLLKQYGLHLELDTVTLYRGEGCDYCRYTGYRGRVGVYEMMKIDDEIRELIVRRASAIEIREMSRKKGMKTLMEDALEKVLEGITSLEEAVRVVYVR